MRFGKMKNNVLPKNDGFAWCLKTSSKTPWFYNLEIVYSIFYYQNRFGNQTYVLSKVKLAALNQFWKMIKERVKFNGSKQRFHNVVKTEGSRKSPTNVKRVSRLKWTWSSRYISEMRTIFVLIELKRAFSNIMRLGFLENEHFS